MVIATVLLLALAIGGTVAWLTANTGNVANTFTPSNVDCEVTEDFNGTIKSNVNVTNTGDTEAYIRVKLVSNIQDNDGNVLRAAPLGVISLGNDWIDGGDGCYYYKNVVEVGQSTSNLLAEGASITLTDGQVVEVLAEGIQAMPKQAVIDAWGQTIANRLN